MSLARTALRLAVIEALKADVVIAALCADRVYDSLIEVFDSTKPVPMIVVLTEEDGGKAFSANNGGPPFNEVCELALEIAVREIVDQDGEPQIAIPQTDRELEASIDLIEHAAIEAIAVGDTPQSRLVRRAVTRRISKFSSVRFASNETGMKLAVREVRLTTELKGEDAASPFDVAAGEFALLPDPLRTVAYAMPEGSSGQQTCRMLAATLTGVPPQVFAGVNTTYAVKRPTYAPSAPLPASDPKGPEPFGDTIVIPQGTS